MFHTFDLRFLYIIGCSGPWWGRGRYYLPVATHQIFRPSYGPVPYWGHRLYQAILLCAFKKFYFKRLGHFNQRILEKLIWMNLNSKVTSEKVTPHCDFVLTIQTKSAFELILTFFFLSWGLALHFKQQCILYIL